MTIIYVTHCIVALSRLATVNLYNNCKKLQKMKQIQMSSHQMCNQSGIMLCFEWLARIIDEERRAITSAETRVLDTRLRPRQASQVRARHDCELLRRSLHKMAHLSDNPGFRQSQKCIFCCVVIAWIEAHWANSRGQLWWVTPGGFDREWDTWVLYAERCRLLSLHFLRAINTRMYFYLS